MTWHCLVLIVTLHSFSHQGIRMIGFHQLSDTHLNTLSYNESSSPSPNWQTLFFSWSPLLKCSKIPRYVDSAPKWVLALPIGQELKQPSSLNNFLQKPNPDHSHDHHSYSRPELVDLEYCHSQSEQKQFFPGSHFVKIKVFLSKF